MPRSPAPWGRGREGVAGGLAATARRCRSRPCGASFRASACTDTRTALSASSGHHPRAGTSRPGRPVRFLRPVREFRPAVLLLPAAQGGLRTSGTQRLRRRSPDGVPIPRRRARSASRSRPPSRPSSAISTPTPGDSGTVDDRLELPALPRRKGPSGDLPALGVGQGPLRSRFRNPAGRSAPGDRIRPVRRRTRAPVRSASDLRRRTGEIRTDWRPAGADTDRHGNPAGIRSSVQRFRTTGGCPILRNVGATRHGPDPPSRGSGRRLARPATPCCGRRRRRHRRPAVHGPGRPAETEVPTPIHAVIPDR